MSRELTLFSDYQGENAVTNYCGLILKLLYEEDPRRFDEFIKAASGGQFTVLTGPVFTQQHRILSSVPDLVIQQRAFSVLVETKLSDWYHKGQLDKHVQGLKAVGGPALLLALSNFESDQYADSFYSRFKATIDQAQAFGIQVRALSFEHFLKRLRGVAHSRRFNRMLDELRAYLDRQHLLPRWRELLDVVNCGKTQDELSLGAYICPRAGAAYSHRRARYLGAYTGGRKVTAIYEIRALVVAAAKQAGAHVEWKNVDEGDATLTQQALDILKQCKPDRQAESQEHAEQLFLLGEKHPTIFVKDSPGGMLHSKLYFRGLGKGFADAKELAEMLRNKKWSEFKR